MAASTPISRRAVVGGIAAVPIAAASPPLPVDAPLALFAADLRRAIDVVRRQVDELDAVCRRHLDGWGQAWLDNVLKYAHALPTIDEAGCYSREELTPLHSALMNPVMALWGFTESFSQEAAPGVPARGVELCHSIYRCCIQIRWHFVPLIYQIATGQFCGDILEIVFLPPEPHGVSALNE